MSKIERTIKGQVVVTDFAVAVANNSESMKMVKEYAKNLHHAEGFSLIIPGACLPYIKCEYRIASTTQDILQSDDGSPAYDVYRKSEAVMITSFTK